MLRRLSVENYALIDKLEMELDPHLNIITGETGAGKSILLGALGLLLGAKNDGQAMKDATRNCAVGGDLRPRAASGLEAFFAENDLDYAPETTLTRMITPAGQEPRLHQRRTGAARRSCANWAARLHGHPLAAPEPDPLVGGVPAPRRSTPWPANGELLTAVRRADTPGLRSCGAASRPCAKRPPTAAATKSGSGSRPRS